MADLARTGMGSFLSRFRGGEAGSLKSVKDHTSEAGNALAQVGESIVVGALLGAADVELAQGLDFHKVPLDLAVGVAGIAGGFAMAGEPVARDLRNSGCIGIGIYTFRKTRSLLEMKKTKKGIVKTKTTARVRGEVEGEVEGEGDTGAEDIGADVDPVITAARAL